MKAVIFDVDGTLYDQRKLRMLMLVELLKYCVVNPLRLQELKILRDFRRVRENYNFEHVNNIENAQYRLGAKASGVSTSKVRSVVEKWIYKVPLKYISHCRYRGVLEFFDNLRNRGISTAIYSDYPAKEKVAALGLSPCCIVCSTDKNVDSLKPNPKGLFHIAETMGISVEHCLFIGDRDERDGECARNAGMQYLILKNRKSNDAHRFRTYHEINEQLKVSS